MAIIILSFPLQPCKFKLRLQLGVKLQTAATLSPSCLPSNAFHSLMLTQLPMALRVSSATSMLEGLWNIKSDEQTFLQNCQTECNNFENK